MAVGMMEINRSDSEELKISKINSNFKALIGCLSKGMTGFTVAGQGYGYYNALRDRLEVDNAYIDNLSTYLMQAKYASIGTAWIQNVGFQQAVGQHLDVEELVARTITFESASGTELGVSFLDAAMMKAQRGVIADADITWLNSQIVEAGNGVFQVLRSGTANITTINADYIRTGTLEFNRLVSIDEGTNKKYFGRLVDGELIWDVQVDGSLVEDNSIGIPQIVNILQGDNGEINLGDGTFSFYKDGKVVLNWNGEKLLIALDSAYIKFVDRDENDADKMSSLMTQYDTISGLDGRVSTLSTGLDNSNGRISAIENWLSIDDAVMTIGRSDQTGVATLTLQADSVELQYDNSTATLTSKGLQSQQALFSNSVKIGGYVLESRKNIGTAEHEHLSLKYIGEQ